MKKIVTLFAVGAIGLLAGCSEKTNSVKESDNSDNDNSSYSCSGVITEDTSWNKTAGVYHITGDLTINADVTWGRRIKVLVDPNVQISIDNSGKLTIQEGVEVSFSDESYIQNGYNTSGTLIAKGSDSLPVKFTKSEGTSSWGYKDGGILLYNKTTSVSELNYCIIEYATTGIYVDNVAVKIMNSVASHCSKYGIHFNGTGAPKDSLNFEKNTFSSNGDYPIVINADGLTKLPGGITFSDNGKSGISVIGEPVISSGTWKKQTVPYVFTSGDYVDISKDGGVSIRVASGVVCKFGTDSYIQVGYTNPGTFIAEGTKTDSIIFTNDAEGSKWGYVNGGGIWCGSKTTDKTSLKYCRIDNATEGIHVDESKIAISNCRIQSNTNSGIKFEDSGSPLDSASFLNNSITGNGKYGIEIDVSNLGNLSGTGTVADNEEGGILVTGDAVTEDAIWKKHDAPYIISEDVDIGDPSGVTVTIRPGAIFELGTDVYIEVGYTNTGVLIADGTKEKQIQFKNHTEGTLCGYAGGESESGILLLYDKTASTSSIKYCTFDNGTGGIYSQVDVPIQNCTFSNYENYGIYYSNVTGTKQSDNTFDESGTGTVYNPVEEE